MSGVHIAEGQELCSEEGGAVSEARKGWSVSEARKGVEA